MLLRGPENLNGECLLGNSPQNCTAWTGVDLQAPAPYCIQIAER